MKERPILFSAPMVIALLNGSKTQTRRKVKWPRCCAADARGAEGVPHNRAQLVDHHGAPNQAGGVFGTDPYLRIPACSTCDAGGDRIRCPFGVVGDRLWVKETHAVPADDGVVYYRATFEAERHDWNVPRWKPSIFMTRRASRITLAITEVRIERLQAIGEEDARAEGVEACPYDRDHRDASEWGGCPCHSEETPRPFACSYFSLWHELNGNGDADPWVWALTFERVRGR